MMLEALIAHKFDTTGPFLDTVIADVRANTINRMDYVAINGALLRLGMTGRPEYIRLAIDKVQPEMRGQPPEGK